MRRRETIRCLWANGAQAKSRATNGGRTSCSSFSTSAGSGGLPGASAIGRTFYAATWRRAHLPDMACESSLRFAPRLPTAGYGLRRFPRSAGRGRACSPLPVGCSLFLNRRKCLVEDVDDDIGLSDREHHRRREADRVAAGAEDQDAAVEHLL